MIVTVRRDSICPFLSEYHPAQMREHRQIQITTADPPQNHKIINKIVFASFGNPMGMCGNFTVGNCHTPATPLVEKLCLGKSSCTLPVTCKDYGAGINCPETTNTFKLSAQTAKPRIMHKLRDD